MQVKLDRQLLLELLIVLLVINYMIITVICHDFAPLKYSRDLILATFAALTICKRKPLSKAITLFIIGIFCFLLIGFIGAYTQSLGILVFRKYAFPLVLLVVLSSYNIVFDTKRFLNFIAYFMGSAATWGIFQAHVLGDTFLRKIGYKVSYSYGYGADMLNNSFYFGGLGIQRVVSTISNSNVCGLIFGMSLILLIIMYDHWEIRFKKQVLAILAVGYILTFSRSNFLAMGAVLIITIWPMLRHKKQIIRYILLTILSIVAFAIYQGEKGILFKIYNWIDISLHMADSSSAGRFGVWTDAFNGVLHNPLGVGFGHVGTIAISENVPNLFTCESSYFAMALDLGWFGAILYYLFWAYMTYKCWLIWKKNKNTENILEAKIGRVATSVLIYHAIVMFFSNHIYDMESISFLFIIVGIALCSSKKTNTHNFIPTKPFCSNY